MHAGWLAALLNLLGMGGSPAAEAVAGPHCGTAGSSPLYSATASSSPLYAATASSEVC